MPTATQLSLFDAAPVRQLLPALPAARPKRSYCQHKRKTVLFLAKHYHCYTLKELAALLKLTERQVFGLCRRNGIKKRAPNGQGKAKAKAHNQPLALAA